jgi:hypothetical protein
MNDNSAIESFFSKESGLHRIVPVSKEERDMLSRVHKNYIEYGAQMYRQGREQAKAELASRGLTAEQAGCIMHNSWCETKRRQGFHHPNECPVRTEVEKVRNLKPLHELCKWCHFDLVAWEQLPEAQKEINRHAFDALNATLSTSASAAPAEGIHTTFDKPILGSDGVVQTGWKTVPMAAAPASEDLGLGCQLAALRQKVKELCACAGTRLNGRARELVDELLALLPTERKAVSDGDSGM